MDRIALLKEARAYVTNALAKVDEESVYGKKNKLKCDQLISSIEPIKGVGVIYFGAKVVKQ